MSQHPPQEPPELEDTGAPDEPAGGLWPPTPKLQIALIGCAFVVINVVLLAIWGILVITR